MTAAALFSARGQEITADPTVVQADRLPDPESGAPFSIDVVDADELRRAPQLRLDDILRAEVPGFSLFRRSSSRTANPTAQGVTLCAVPQIGFCASLCQNVNAANVHRFVD